MKRKVRVKIKTKLLKDKVIEREYNTRDLDHFKAQVNHRSNIFTPKKGKGSFKRREKFTKKDYF